MYRFGVGEMRSSHWVAAIVVPPHHSDGALNYAMLNGFPRLRRLEFRNSTLNMHDIEIVTKCSSLNSIVIADSNVNVELLTEALADFSGGSLDCSNVNFDGTLGEHFWRSVRGVENIRIVDSFLKDSDITGLKYASGIEGLSLKGNLLTDKSSEEIRKASGVKAMDLRGNMFSESMMKKSQSLFGD